MATVYGTSFTDTAHAALLSAMNALITATAVGYDPRLGHAYGNHRTAKLQVNAVTLELSGASPDEELWAGDAQIRWMLTFTVRVHTDYDPGKQDALKQARLLNSITSKLLANRTLASGFRVENIDNLQTGLTFDDSQTLGGSLEVMVSTNVLYTQE